MKVLRVLFVALVLTMLVGVVLRSSPFDSLRHVRFVLPNGFRGVVALVEDPTAPEIPVVSGRRTVTFPPDGIARVRSYEPVDGWYVLDADTWTFEDGATVEEVDPWSAHSMAPDALRVFGGGTMQRSVDGRIGQRMMFKVVAEARDAEAVREQVDAVYVRIFPQYR